MGKQNEKVEKLKSCWRYDDSLSLSLVVAVALSFGHDPCHFSAQEALKAYE